MWLNFAHWAQRYSRARPCSRTRGFLFGPYRRGHASGPAGGQRSCGVRAARWLHRRRSDPARRPRPSPVERRRPPSASSHLDPRPAADRPRPPPAPVAGRPRRRPHRHRDARRAAPRRRHRAAAGHVAGLPRGRGVGGRRARRSGWDVQQQSFPVPGGHLGGRADRGAARRGGPLGQRDRHPRRRRPRRAVARWSAPTSTPCRPRPAPRTTPPASARCSRSPRRSPTSGPGCPSCSSRSARRSRAGRSDDDHHYGSRAYVDSLTRAERRSLRGMIAMDRVGVGTRCRSAASRRTTRCAPRSLAVARRARDPDAPESGQRSSDHWSFVREGMPGVRLGSTPYAGYHSPDDVVAVVDPAQVTRAARIVVAWLR